MEDRRVSVPCLGPPRSPRASLLSPCPPGHPWVLSCLASGELERKGWSVWGGLR